MRIIAGQRRGHKIDGPRDASNTRPTSDMVRESLFNILGELVEGRTFLDLFAGTGAVGLEALSRGAEYAIFVEMDRENVGLIHRNAAILRYETKIRVRHADAYRWTRTFQPLEDRPMVVFLDPPYRDYESKSNNLNLLIANLEAKLPAGSAIALEAGRGIRDLQLSETDWDLRKYGNKRVAIRILPEAGRENMEISLSDEAASDSPPCEGGAGGVEDPSDTAVPTEEPPCIPPFQGGTEARK